MGSGARVAVLVFGTFRMRSTMGSSVALFAAVALPRVLSQSTGCSHSCCDALDERRSSYGRSSIDGAYEDCTTLALLGHCRTAGHFCDRSCGRCANAREDAEPAWGDVGGWAPGRWGEVSLTEPGGAAAALRVVLWADESLASAFARFCLIVDTRSCRDHAPALGEALLVDDGDPAATLAEFGARLPTTWADVRHRARLGFPVRLNVGGNVDCAPFVWYWDFVCVGFRDLKQRGLDKSAGEPDPGRVPFFVVHDLTEPMDLPDNAVDEILSEHVLEHLPLAAWPSVLREWRRVLRPGGVARLALPDYGAPRHAASLAAGFDASDPSHVVLPTAALLRAQLDACGLFPGYHVRQYWDGDAFVDEPVRPAYAGATGHVKRAPENAPLWAHAQSIGARYGRLDDRGRPEDSSLVVDMHKSIG